jgi:molybdopterin/thiamine biosynthesis adenylyltransferase
MKIATKPFAPLDARFRTTHRQELITGFSQEQLLAASAVLIGAGGIGGEIGHGLCRKGVGRIRIFDHDVVDSTNLNRQHFFANDVGRPKAERLEANLAAHCHAGTELEGLAFSFQDALALGCNVSGTVVICGVDNGKTRVGVSEYYRRLGIPVIFIAVDMEAEAGQVFVQESAPNSACFGCAFPRTMKGARAPCFVPSAIDILKVVAGLALYAVDSLLMERRRNWNYRLVHLAGFAPDVCISIPRNADCPLCGPEAAE